jgi:hypothetical protein
MRCLPPFQVSTLASHKLHPSILLRTHDFHNQLSLSLDYLINFPKEGDGEKGEKGEEGGEGI